MRSTEVVPLSTKEKGASAFFSRFRNAVGLGNRAKSQPASAIPATFPNHSAPDGVVLNVEGTVIHSSHSLARMVGAKSGDLADRKLLDQIHLLDRTKFLSSLREVVETQQDQQLTLRMRAQNRDNAVWLTFAVQLVPFVDPQNSQPCIRCEFDDVTEINALKAELTAMQARYQSEAAKRLELRALVDHKLRNGLTAILGYSELLQSSENRSTSDVQKYAKSIFDAGRVVQSTTETLVCIEEIAAGSFQPAARDFSWQGLLCEVEPVLQMAAAKNEIDIKLDVSPGLPDACGDEAICEKILTNFVLGAVRLSPTKSAISVKLRQHGRSVQLIVDYGRVDSKADSIVDPAPKTINNDPSQWFEFQAAFALTEAIGGRVSRENLSWSGGRLTALIPLRHVANAQDHADPHPSKNNAPTNRRSPKTVDNEGEYCARLSA